MEHPKPIEAARNELIDAGGRTAQSFGLNRLLGKIYVLLYMQPEPLSLDELMEELGVSKASVSIACRQLQSLGALRRVWQKGDRRDYYEAVTDLKELVQNGLLREVEKKLDSAGVQLERCRAVLEEGGSGEDTAFMLQRLEKAEALRKKFRGVLGNRLLRWLF